MLEDEFPHLPADFLVRRECQLWGAKIDDPEILPRWMQLVCTIKTIDPSLDQKRLVAPSGRLSDPLQAFLHYPTYNTHGTMEYGVVNDTGNGCIRLVDNKLDLQHLFVNDVDPWRTRRVNQQDKKPYLPKLSDVMEEFDKFNAWLLSNIQARVVVSFGKTTKDILWRSSNNNRVFAIDSNIQLYNSFQHVAGEQRDDGSEGKLYFVYFHPGYMYHGLALHYAEFLDEALNAACAIAGHQVHDQKLFSKFVNISVRRSGWRLMNMYLPPLFAASREIAARLNKEFGPLPSTSDQPLIEMFPLDDSIVVGGIPPQIDNDLEHALFQSMHHLEVIRYCSSNQTGSWGFTAHIGVIGEWMILPSHLKALGLLTLQVIERSKSMTERNIYYGRFDDDPGLFPAGDVHEIED